MIDPKELRLGNLVAFNWPTGEGATIYCITEILEGGLRGVQPKYQDYPSEYLSVGVEGIPLSPEWLERCGVEFFEADTATESLINLVYKQKVIVTFKSNSLPPREHLHQLQNLIHTLTGTELEIKLP